MLEDHKSTFEQRATAFITMRMIHALISVSLLLLSKYGDAFRPSSSFVPASSLKSTVRSDSNLFMKTIAVIGASGLTASECVYQALRDGDNVVGLTR